MRRGTVWRQVSPSFEASGRGLTCVSVRSLWRVQELVDVGLEHVEREGPDQEFDGFALGTVALGRAEEEGRGAGHTDCLAILEALMNLRGVLTAVQTGLAGLDVQPQGLSVLPQRLGLELLWMGEQAVVHLAAFPLCAGTPQRLGGFAGQRVDRLQREVTRHIKVQAGEVWLKRTMLVHVAPAASHLPHLRGSRLPCRQR